MDDFSSLLQAFINGEQSIEELQSAIDRELEQGGKPQVLQSLKVALSNGAMDTSTHQLLESLVNSQDKDLKTRIFDRTDPNPTLPIGQNPTLPLQAGAAEGKNVTAGTVLNGRFRLEERIGAGGMGVVFKATDLRKVEAQDREPFVAIKILSKEVQSHPQALIALQRESKKSQKLAHPNIVTVYDFDRDDATVYMTMEYLTGEPLDQLIRREAPLPRDKVYSIIKDIVAALSHAHKNGIVHSDFKPGNIYILEDGTTKILDFGIARAVKPTDSQAAAAADATIFDPRSLSALTPAYASCEILDDKPSDPRDDIYALGCIAYELLTSRHPFNRLPATLARDSAVNPSQNDSLSRKEWKAIQHAIELSQEQRTPTVEAFRDEFINSAGVEKSNKGLVLTAAVLIALLAGGGGYYIYTDSEGTQTGTASNSNLPASERIEQFRVRAKAKMAAGELLRPKNDNALLAYREIIELAPNDQSAKDGISKIKTHYIEQAKTLLSQNNTADAEATIQTALSFFPGDRDLTGIINLIQNADIKLKSKKIGHLIGKAQQEINSGQFVSPTDNNASSTLQQALALEPNNQNIQIEVDRLLSKIIENSAQLIENGELSAAEQLLQGGLAAAPQNQQVSALLELIAEARMGSQAKAQAESKAKEDATVQVDTLIIRANELLGKEILISPRNDNALYFYTEALKILPDSQEAQDGIAVIRGYYLGRISDHLANEDTESAASTINQALQAFPGDTDLLKRKSALSDIHSQRLGDNIADLISKAKNAFSLGQLISPDNDNAVAYTQQVLKIDPDNIEGRNILNSVGDSLHQRAIEFKQNNEWDNSLTAINRALEISPENITYNDLRKQIYQETARQNDLQQKFKQTRRILSTTSLIMSEATQAHTLFVSVLESDPDNAEAQAGIQELQIKLFDSANELLTSKLTTESLTYTQSALAIFPNNKRFKKLITVIQKTEADINSARQLEETISFHSSKANELMSSGALYSPKEANAGLHFSKMLELDPKNGLATDSLAEIFRALKTKIKSLKAEGQNQQALQELSAGSQLFPNNAELSALRESLLTISQMKKEKNQLADQIKKLLSAADKHFKAKRWSSPANKNALNSYKKILSIAPGNEPALAGIEKVKKKYIDQANKHIKSKNWRAAEATAKRGQTVFPKTKQFSEFGPLILEGKENRKRIALEQRQKEKGKTKKFLKQAKSALSKDNWTTPPGKNAFELYQRVLKREPKNKAAIDGIAQIKTKLLQQISTELSNNNLEKTKFWLDQAAAISFSSRRLNSLKKDYKNKLTLEAKLVEIAAAVDNNQLEHAYQILEETYFLDPSNPTLRRLRSTIESKLRAR